MTNKSSDKLIPFVSRANLMAPALVRTTWWRWLGLLLALFGLLGNPRPAEATGTWAPLNQPLPNGAAALMLLLSDGTVLAEDSDTQSWHRLTPDIHGSYVNGIWSNLAAMHDTRLYFSSQVLRDGRVFVAGGEYGSGRATAEVYDPVSNTWTLTPSSGQSFSDSVSEILPNGNVLVAPVGPSTYGGTVIYNPTLNTWSAGPTLYRGGYQDEASWVKLADASIVTIDPFGINSERYLPAANTWVNDGVLPAAMYDSLGEELGAAFLLPNGKAFFLGGNGNTALYTPTGNSNPGTWTAGPVIPNGQATPDAPAAMMPNGKILCAVSPPIYATNGHNVFPPPTTFYEYDSVANSFTSVNGPTGATSNEIPYETRMLVLPDGTVLFTSGVVGGQLYVYQPDGSPLAAGKPAISSLTTNSDGSYHLTGTLFNGISEGAAYGDDAQMNSNYPLVRLTDSSGNVYYARTYNWSSTGVMTGNNPVTTEFTLPAGLPPGTYSLVVIANGNSSNPVSFSNSVPLQITSQPTNQVVFAGASVTFTVTATGQPPLVYAWKKNSTPLSDGGLVSGTGTATLTLRNVAAPGGDTYSVVVTNASGSVTSTGALLTVYPQALQNGSFEMGNFTGWTQSGNTGSTFVTGNSFPVYSGIYAAQLGPVGSLGYLSQMVPTSAGKSYLISLWLDSPDGRTNNEFLAAWNGAVLFDQTNLPALGWTNLQFVVRATGSSSLLQLGFRDDPSYLSLDDVIVSELDYLTLEAEAGTVVAPMTILSNPAASQGKYIASPSNGAGSAVYNFTITNAGQYVMWCRILGVSAGADSFFVSVDGGPELVYDVSEQIWSTNWQWTRVLGRIDGNPVNLNPRIFNLSAGSHTFQFRARDPNTGLDRLLLTSNTHFMPVLGFEAEASVVTAPMAIRADPAASGGQYVSSLTANQGQAQFTFGVATPATYYIWCRVLGINSNSDSFYVAMDGGTQLVYDAAEGTWTNAWQWTRLNGRPEGGAVNLAPRSFFLTQTNHSLVFQAREANAGLDRLLIVTDLNYNPNLNSTITATKLAGGNLDLQFYGQAGLIYYVQSTPTLPPAAPWTAIFTNTAVWDGTIDFQAPRSGGSRYYRVLLH